MDESRGDCCYLPTCFMREGVGTSGFDCAMRPQYVLQSFIKQRIVRNYTLCYIAIGSWCHALATRGDLSVIHGPFVIFVARYRMDDGVLEAVLKFDET